MQRVAIYLLVAWLLAVIAEALEVLGATFLVLADGQGRRVLRVIHATLIDELCDDFIEFRILRPCRLTLQRNVRFVSRP